jgi:hypothetical protein
LRLVAAMLTLATPSGEFGSFGPWRHRWASQTLGRMRKPGAIIVALTLVGLVVLSAPAAAQVKNHKVGETVTTAFDFAVKVIGAEDPWTPIDPSEARSGSRYVVVWTRVTNKSADAQMFVPSFAFRLFDRTKHAYELETTGCNGLPEFPQPAADLEPEQSAQGFLCFSVPEGAQGIKLQLVGRFIGDRQRGFVFKLT